MNGILIQVINSFGDILKEFTDINEAINYAGPLANIPGNSLAIIVKHRGIVRDFLKV